MQSSSTNWKTFYHETSLVSANSIISHQLFRPSKMGNKHNPLFGPGIYFATTINGAHFKSNHHGYCLSADVLINKPKEITKDDVQNFKNDNDFWQQIRNNGYDSIYGLGMRTGDEVVVFNENQIKNIKLVKCMCNSQALPTAICNLDTILNTREKQVTLFYVANNKYDADSIISSQTIPKTKGVFGYGVYLYNTIDDALAVNPSCNIFISVYADLSNVHKVQPNENANSLNYECMYGEVNSINHFYFKDSKLLSSIHICGDSGSKKDMTVEVMVKDLPMNRKEKNETTSPVENFLNKLFFGYGIKQGPDAIKILTKKDHYGIPSSAYAFVKFENLDKASKAINDLNYTRFKGIQIRLVLGDDETKRIIDSKIGNIYVKNLDSKVEVSQLHNAFAKYGEIISCEIPSDVEEVGDERKNVSHGYGYVQFRRLECAQKAINDSGKIQINGKTLIVENFKKNRNQGPDPFMSPFQSPNQFMSPFQSPSPFMNPLQSPDPFMSPFQSPGPFMNPLQSPDPFMSPFQSPNRNPYLRHNLNQSPNLSRSPQATFTNCSISNLPPSFTKDDLQRIFSEFGTPISCIVGENKQKANTKYGYCNMSNHYEAVMAVQNLNGRNINGHIVKCERAMDKPEREALKKRSNKIHGKRYK